MLVVCLHPQCNLFCSQAESRLLLSPVHVMDSGAPPRGSAVSRAHESGPQGRMSQVYISEEPIVLILEIGFPVAPGGACRGTLV